jgi:glycosyltransferase involved in cell wall biosynthesis
MESMDPNSEFVRYSGPVPYAELPSRYHQADLFVFASSCENMPNVLVEAMVAGLPIACSDRGPMPEVLGPDGIYFDPELPDQIADAIQALLDDPALRARAALNAQRRVAGYDWQKCTRATADFLVEIEREFDVERRTKG